MTPSNRTALLAFGATSFLATFTILLGYGINNHIENITAQTAVQCMNHDWPAHLHAEHVEFCKDAGFPVYIPANTPATGEFTAD